MITVLSYDAHRMLAQHLDTNPVSMCLGLGLKRAVPRSRWNIVSQRVKIHHIRDCTRDSASLSGSMSSSCSFHSGGRVMSLRESRFREVAGVRQAINSPKGPPSRRSALLSTIILTGMSWSDLWNPLYMHAVASPLSQALDQEFKSSEGFRFSFPSGWVVAYDRSGGRGNGAVAAVGDFSRFLVVTVFREVININGDDVEHLNEGVGRKLVLDGPASSQSTLRFTEIKSDMVVNDPTTYEFEYEIETCTGEIEEGSGGVIRCLASFNGQSIPTIKRHIVGRSILRSNESESVLLTIAAAAPVKVWNDSEVAQTMQAIIDSYGAR